ncbi:MAG TPA: 30S ribosomal protein S8 [Aggregatilinea sp.]|uniref:30S ribosomal protein S8 n=2 Tax=Aggregatilinea sp. TaxID=2806333 RepID=UPI002C198BCE|nr:30S ribosomal protein S8 [Aggregatilinea sp.]HML22137.1 30S ribosomal protein S8 [Aggregatilinea sp.]
MMTNDPISDMLTRIRNAVMVGHTTVSMPNTKVLVAVAKILKAEGYIEDFSVGDETPAPILTIQLKYWGKRRERRPVVSHLERVSKPGRRVYVSRKEIPWVMSGLGIAVLSTPQGVMTGHQAYRRGIGGEVLCYVW